MSTLVYDSNNIPTLSPTPSGPGGVGLNNAFSTISSLITAANAAVAALQTAITTLTTSDAAKLAKASNLSDLANAATARTNLGLGSAATHATTDYDASGAAATVNTALSCPCGTDSSSRNVWCNRRDY